MTISFATLIEYLVKFLELNKANDGLEFNNPLSPFKTTSYFMKVFITKKQFIIFSFFYLR